MALRSRQGRSAFILVLLMSFVALPRAAHAQSVLHFSRVISDPTIFTGLAISNPSTQNATLTLRALDPDGTLWAGSATNPVSVSLPAGGQYTRTFREVFGGEQPFNGWVEATSEVSGLAGFFLNGNGVLTDLDGAGASEPLAEFLFPFVSDDGVAITELTIVNPNPARADLTLQLHRADGSILGSTDLAIAPDGLIRQPLTVLFDAVDTSDASYVRVMGDRPLVGLELVANFLVPETPVKRRESVMLAGQPIDGSEQALLSQFVSGFGWMSHVGVVNSGGIGQEVTLTAYRDDGELWDGATNPARLPLEANEAIRFGVGELFGFPPSELRSGWIEVEATLGHVSTFIGLGHGTVPSFALVSGTDLAKASNLLTVANFVDGETFFTGLTVNNPGVLDATVDVFVLRDDGTTLGKATLSIPARQTHARLFGDLVPASVGQGGVWAFVSSDQPIVAAALMGTTNGLSLANVNPQPSAVAFNPPAQTRAAITGSVTQGNLGSPGVTIALEGPVHGSTTTDGSGRFAFTDLLPGSYAVRPSAAGATFAPVERSVELTLVNVDRIDFESGGVVPAELPVLDVVSPSATFEGNTTMNLRVLGSNFTPASVLQINGVSAPTIFVSSTELNAVPPEEQTAQAAVLTLSVLTAPPGGGSSGPFDFLVNEVLDDPLIVGRVGVGAFPAGVAIDPVTNQALVTSEASDSVFFVDLDELRIIGEVTVGRSPTELALDAELRLAVVANVGSNNVSIIDLETRSVVATVKVGRFPMGVAVDPGARRAFVVNGEDDSVSIIDLGNFTVTGRLSVANRPAGIAVDPETNRILITERGSGRVSIIDPDSGATLGQIPSGDFPRGIAVNSATNTAVVANANSGDVSVIDLTTGITTSLDIDPGPTSVAIDPVSNNAVVTSSGFVRGQGSLGAITTVTFINLDRVEVLAEVEVGATAFGVDVASETGKAVVANSGGNDITVLRLPNPEPHITDIEPKTFPFGVSSVTVTIRGTGFLPTSVVTLNGQVLATTFVSSTEVRAVIPGTLLDAILTAASAELQAIGLDDSVASARRRLGLVDFNIGVRNPGPGGGDSTPDPEITNIEAENPVPVLTRTAPNDAIAGKDVVLTLVGNNFNLTSIVSFDGVELVPGTTSSQAMTVRIPADQITPGDKTVFVVNPEPGGGPSDALIFTVVARRNEPPRISSVSPAEIEAGGEDVAVTIEGSGFGEDTTVRLDGAEVVEVTETRIDLIMDGSQLDQPGRLNGLVSNRPPGGGSAPFSISVVGVPPVISGFAPEGAPVDSSPIDLVVSGENFERRTKITLEGTRVPTTFVSSSRLVGRISRGILKRAGMLSVGVVSPPPGGGSAKAEALFLIESTAPSLLSVSPSTVTPDQGRVTISVFGSGFVGNSQILIDGEAIRTLSDSSSELTGILDRDILSVPGVYALQVLNPEGGGPSPETLELTVGGSVAFIRNINPKSIGAGEAGIVIIVRGDGFTPSAEVVLLGTFVGATGERLNLQLELAVGTEFIDERTLSFELPFAGENGSPIGVQVWNSLDSRSNVAIIEVGPRSQGSGNSGNQGQGNAGDDGDSSPGDSGNQGQGDTGDDGDSSPGNSGDQGGGSDDSGGAGSGGGSGNQGQGNAGDDGDSSPGNSGDQGGGSDDSGGAGSGGGSGNQGQDNTGDDGDSSPGNSGDQGGGSDDSGGAGSGGGSGNQGQGGGNQGGGSDDSGGNIIPPQFGRGGGGNQGGGNDNSGEDESTGSGNSGGGNSGGSSGGGSSGGGG